MTEEAEQSDLLGVGTGDDHRAVRQHAAKRVDPFEEPEHDLGGQAEHDPLEVGSVVLAVAARRMGNGVRLLGILRFDAVPVVSVHFRRRRIEVELGQLELQHVHGRRDDRRVH
ncbi:MAG: hypothetical protein D6731_04045, partial [Planctomycetota bacterium]